VFRSTWEGLKYVSRDPKMRVIVAAALLPSFLVYPYVTFLPVFARDILGSDQTGYGYLASAVGLGSLLGGTVVAMTSGADRQGRRMTWSLLLYCAAVGAFALSRNLWLSVAILAFAGVFHSVYSALNGALMQLQADTAYRARVMALQSMTWGVTPFAALAMGNMIDRWGAPHVVLGWMIIASILSLPIALFSKEMRRV
jgi:MFS family permease